jgi:integrase
MPAFMTALREREDAGARAVELAVLCTLRTNEVRSALWSEIDLERKLWTIPAARMKMARDHAVPLSEQAVELLSALPHSSHKVFDLGENSMRNAVKAVGFGGTPHGIARSTFKDWARTLTQYADEVSELCLAHVDSSATRAAYARDGLLELRREMLQSWADYLDKTTTE